MSTGDGAMAASRHRVQTRAVDVVVQADLVPFSPAHTDELIAMWRASFEDAVGVPEPHLSRSSEAISSAPSCRTIVCC